MIVSAPACLLSDPVNDLVRALNEAGAAAVSTVIPAAVVLLPWPFWRALRRVGGGVDPFAAIRT